MMDITCYILPFQLWLCNFFSLFYLNPMRIGCLIDKGICLIFLNSFSTSFCIFSSCLGACNLYFLFFHYVRMRLNICTLDYVWYLGWIIFSLWLMKELFKVLLPPASVFLANTYSHYFNSCKGKMLLFCKCVAPEKLVKLGSSENFWFLYYE